MSTTTLPPETWGQRFARARRFSGLELRQTSEIISDVLWPVSEATIRRFETLDEAPERARSRALATLTLLAYGIDPSDFDLSVDDLPRGLDRKRLSTRGLRMSRWTEPLPA